MKRTLFKKVSSALIVISLFSGLTIYAQQVKDSDGNFYRTVKYGLQEWMGNNLSVTHFRNGDAIPQAKTEEEWLNAANSKKPAWCYYENDQINGQKYGKLYNWYAINDRRGLAPAGWRVPENQDWRTLIKNLLGIDVAGEKLKSPNEWKKRKGTNKIGFSALPSGYRDQQGKFLELGFACRYWSNSVPVDVKPSDKIFSVSMDDASPEMKYIQNDKGAGLSVRCIKE